jgi:hypothetical protein
MLKKYSTLKRSCLRERAAWVTAPVSRLTVAMEKVPALSLMT